MEVTTHLYRTPSLRELSEDLHGLLRAARRYLAVQDFMRLHQVILDARGVLTELTENYGQQALDKFFPGS